MSKLPTFRSNPPEIANSLNLLAREIERIGSREVIATGRLTSSQDGDGNTTIFFNGEEPAVVAAQADHPWKPYAVTGGYKIIPGTVDNRLPSNLNVVWVPTPDVQGAWVYLTVAMSQTGQAASLEYTGGSSVPATPLPSLDGTIPPTFYVPLFSYDSVGTTVSRFYISARTNMTTRLTLVDNCTQFSRNVVIE